MIGSNLALRAVKRAMFCIFFVLSGSVVAQAIDGITFVWFVDKADAETLTVRGNTPNEKLMTFLAENAGITFTNDTVITEGAPKGFSTAALASINALSNLEDGRAYFDGQEWTLAGHALSQDARTAAISALVTFGQDMADWNIIISAPERTTEPAQSSETDVEVMDQKVSETSNESIAYGWFFNKSENGTFAARGNSPTAGFVAFLASNAAIEIDDSSQATQGAPKGFATAALAGITALGDLDYGRVYFEHDEWTLSGGAASSVDLENAEQSLVTYGQDIADWNVIISVAQAVEPEVAEPEVVEEIAAVEPETPEPYLWEITKADGAYAVTGQSPSEKFIAFLAENAGQKIADKSRARIGAPKGFATAALAGVTALGNLENGRVYFDGREWTIAGHADSAENSDQAENTLVTYGQKVADWNIIITATESEEMAEAEPMAAPEPEVEVEQEPAPEPEMEIQTASPYVWHVEKSDNGIRSLSGFAPSESLRDELAWAMGGGANDTSKLASGAPAGFELNSFAAIWTLGSLESGKAGFDGTSWSITGRAPNMKTLKSAYTSIETNASATDWTIALDISLAQCRTTINQIMAETTIIFGSGSARITDESLEILDQIATVMNACSQAGISVEGHTDSYGPDAENMDLSVRRALVVSDYLAEKNVASERMTVIGYGESAPIATNDTRAGRAQNRRIVFQIQTETE